MAPAHIFVFSGKRKCGKDFITDKLHERIGDENCVLLRLAAPIKFKWAQEKGLDYNRLLDNSGYKEKYRYEMVKWGESVRQKDPGYFCRATVEMFNATTRPIWIITDCRRRSDLAYFRETYGTIVKSVKVTATQEVRTARGWVFTPGIDDAETECDMDSVTEFDFTFDNNGDFEDVKDVFDKIVELVDQALN